MGADQERYAHTEKGRATGRRSAAKYAATKKGRAVRLARELERRAYVDAAKDVPCMDCEGRFPPEAMDFDHRDPATKEFSVSSAAHHGIGWDRILAEIEKCDIVCANCHRVRTKRRMQ